jgi:oligopeptide transport system permease protein
MTKTVFSEGIPAELLEASTDAQGQQEEINRPGQTYLQSSWRRFREDPLAIIGLVVLTVITILAVVAPMVCPYSYDETDFTAILTGPSSTHWFGTDLLGRDVFVRTMYGARISLTIGFACAAINMVIGVFYGEIAGYFGGKTDMVMMRIVDVLSAVPSLLYLILIMMFIGASVKSILLAMCLTYWITTARMVRGQIFALREQDYVMAARVCGMNKWDILIHHLIPNSMGSIIVTVSFLIPSAIFEEAFLSFLGIGIQIPRASWGTMCNDAIPYLMNEPYLMIFPAIAISVTIFALNFIGDGLRDALDPRLSRE